jgi:glycosyltransferase involved in cell wall biosynthesis
MAEKEASAAGERTGEPGNLAVGIVATRSNGDALARTVLRATERGHEVFVTHRGDPTLEALDFARRLGATVVDPSEPDPGGEALRRELAAVARAHSCSGIVFQSEACDRIDYGRTEATFEDGVYGVDAVHAGPTGTSTTPFVLVGIPAYDEADSIGGVVESVAPHASEVVVVDDGSDDDTARRAAASGATVVEHGENRGYGAALNTLFREAKRRRADHLVVLDGDGQHEPEDVPRLVERQRETGSELVIGSRFVDGAETDVPLTRRVGLSVINVLTNISLGIVRPGSRIRDTQSGLRAYSREAIESLAADDDVGSGMDASTDILYHAHHRGYAIEEVDTTVYYDVDDGSTHNPLAHGLGLLHNIVKTVEAQRPVTVLGVPGIVATVIGAGFGYWTLLNYFNTGSFPYGLAIVSTFFVLAGIFSTFTGIILHSLNRRLMNR